MDLKDDAIREEINLINQSDSKYKAKMIKNVDARYFGEYADKISSTDVLITKSVLVHIKKGHSEDFVRITDNIEKTIERPETVLEDDKTKNSLIFIRKLRIISQNVIVRLRITGKKDGKPNIVKSSYNISDKRVEKLLKRCRIIYRDSS